ncbi:hypothetical protein PUW24_06095 [Paenibacillus urinalis]|uniref:Uncharacterized protein n=1 Tax=Paenibacillus urinalis TaxID=521520 RepID=A0AAX3MYP5_9BACL|nr:hypothetical protein [Paenibacillus urinalis]WDH82437.1 hypothetical protein PUW23_23825 [Paenibacillus urinalis]WDH98494.1 hypothetical protein PUW24_06095 [Paenibacillus urinalis]WDI02185.1 hypothetical protein PUW25_23820 [Paenibacillus urinalis]
MNMIWHVGCDGMAMPVAAETRAEAEQKAEKHLAENGYRCGRILATKASQGYLEWIEAHQIPVLL